MGPNAERLVKILDVIVYLFVDTYVPIVYRVMSSSTKSTTLAFTDIGFQKKKLSKWNRTPKGSSIFGNTRAYLLVDTYVPIVYRVMSSSTKSTTLALTDIGFQKKKKLSKWNRTPKGSSIFGNTRAYLLVDTCVPIMYRVMSSSTKSTTLAFTDIGFQKIFQNGTERRKARQFLVIREPIFSLVRL
jgi:archaellum component FlaF (FlaF/FlaG flagellin family)